MIDPHLPYEKGDLFWLSHSLLFSCFSCTTYVCAVMAEADELIPVKYKLWRNIFGRTIFGEKDLRVEEADSKIKLGA